MTTPAGTDGVQTSVQTPRQGIRLPSCRRSLRGRGHPPDTAAEEARVSKTGSIKKTGSTWGFVLDVGRSNGRRQQVRKRGFRTRKEAQSALNDALADLQHGSYVRPRRVTFGEYLDEWVANRGARRSSTDDDCRLSKGDPALRQAHARRLRAATDHGGRHRSALRTARVGGKCRRWGGSRKARSARCTR